MKEQKPDPQRLQRGVVSPAWPTLTQAGIDPETFKTWDLSLSRRTRILVPCDVQAFVVPREGGELTVPLTGSQGDPAPFAEGVPRPTGVHVHWAMPDALLRGAPAAAADGESEGLVFPPLPDRWVVVRAVMPVGHARASLRAWVLDASTGSVTPLPDFQGTPAPAPSGIPTLDPLDAAYGGSLLWTASYTASAGRFGFHDALDDLSTSSEALVDEAVYVVAGWWSDLARDPLAPGSGRELLDDRLGALGWLLTDDDITAAARGPGQPQNPPGRSSPDDSPAVRGVTADGGAATVVGVDVRAALPVADASGVLLAPAGARYATMVHGAVLGVPIRGTLPAGVDDRPTPAALSVALGLDIDDVVAAFGKAALGSTQEQRAAAERLAAAFTSDLLDRLGSADGIADLDEREHGDQFVSTPGTPLPGARPDRLRGEDAAAMGPFHVGRKGRGAAARDDAPVGARLGWKTDVDLVERAKGGRKTSGRSEPRGRSDDGGGGPRGAAATVREVHRPAPRWYHPQPAVVAVRGANPNPRHHGDGLYDDLNRLRCRHPSECVPGWEGVVSGEVVVPSLGSGAVPAEVLSLVREAVVLNPYAVEWLAAAGTRTAGDPRVPAFETRLRGEMVRLFGVDGRYDGSSHLGATARGWEDVSAAQTMVDRQVVSALAEFSLLPQTPPSPVALTTWRQPWVPLWLEWRVTLEGSGDIAGWTLGALDLVPPAAPAITAQHTFTGRSPLGHGVATALHRGIDRWLGAETQRDAAGASVLDDADARALGRLGDFLGPLDLMSASLDGVREQLLGIPYLEGAALDDAGKPLATGWPTPLFGGTLRLDALRLVDAFGRTLPVPAASAEVATTLDLAVPGLAHGIWWRPRFQHAARWLFRLVDPAPAADADPASAREAFVDQLDPTLAVNPVAGFLLPDPIDEALEVFDVAGAPLGQVGHDAVSGAVLWEPAPGRPLPPDAGPLADLPAHARLTGEIAAGLVRADVAARVDGAPSGSALTALLRAIDSTLWTVDTYAAVGSPTVAGLIGRPVAVVRATLRLDVPDDLDRVTVAAEGGPTARAAAFATLAEQQFPFRLGTLQRADDGLLGFFVDDDFEHLHLVDRVVASGAREVGRHRGHLGLLGRVTVPTVDALVHPYILADDVLWIRPGQTLRLTLLLLPAGKVHLTSGVLPRKALALTHDWVGPGLARLMPSVRVGPLVVDPSEIRLPQVHVLGDTQSFTRRTGPLTWRDDPILAATQTALLPRLPHEVQEGWIRVTPDDPEAAS